jgi:transposase
VEQLIELESTLCPCGCGEMARIGEDVSERLDIIPAQFRVLVTRRPKYACRHRSGTIIAYSKAGVSTNSRVAAMPTRMHRVSCASPAVLFAPSVMVAADSRYSR